MSETRTIVEPAARDKKLFCFGFGYTAGFLAERLMAYGWKVAGTTTSAKKRDFLVKNGIEAYLFDRTRPITDPYHAFAGVTHVLLSIPPGADGDPAFALHGADLAEMKQLEWVGYLSTTAIYGDQDGKWVDEKTPPAPSSRRGSLRLKAEEQWTSLLRGEGLPLHTFRIAGIYGPGRSAIDAVRSGTAQCIDKPGHVFNRIHVDDIVQALIASMNAPKPGAIYNLADDSPSSSLDVVRFACNLLGREPPAFVSYDQAELAPIVRSFYKDNKRVHNTAIKDELGIQLLHPDYHSGLRACFKVEREVSDLLRFATADSVGE